MKTACNAGATLSIQSTFMTVTFISHCPCYWLTLRR